MKKLLILCVMLVSASVFAADGSSGCGPGWFVFKKNSLLQSSLRATTNGFLGATVTIGMTMGTSGCSKHSIVKNEKESLKFATENYYEIAVDASRGEGDFVSSYGVTIGCNKDKINVFNKHMKKNLKSIYEKSNGSAEEMLKETYKMIFSNEALVQSCVLS